MDAMDILGALLGKKMQSSGRGGDILRDMAAGKSRPPAPPRKPTPSRQSRPRTIGDAAKELEDILNVSRDHHAQRRQAPAPQREAPQRQTPAPQRQTPAPQRQTSAPTRSSQPDPANEQAEVLVRAMVNAAKSDGQITREEQQEIMGQLGHVTQDEIDFLQQEFSRELDVREFAWSVPVGMEEQVYQVSVIAIDLDEMKEAHYLADLAHGLRLPPERCNAIHQRLGAPVIFQQ